MTCALDDNCRYIFGNTSLVVEFPQIVVVRLIGRNK